MSIVPRIRQGSAPAVSEGRPKASASGGWLSGYMRGENSPIFRGWYPQPRDPADAVRAAWARAAGRAQDIIHNSGWISGAIDQAVANTVGIGLRPRLMVDAEALGWTEDEATDWAARVEARFLGLYANNPYECDIENRRTFGQMQAAAFRSWFGPGEIVSECAWKRRPGGAYGSKIRLIPAHRLSQRTASPRLVQGIQMDADWMPLAVSCPEVHKKHCNYNDLRHLRVALFICPASLIAPDRFQRLSTACDRSAAPRCDMARNKESEMQTDDDDLLYGVPAIAEHMRLKPAQVYHLDAKGHIPTFRVGAKVCWSKSGYRRWLAEQEAAARQPRPAPEPAAPQAPAGGRPEGRRRGR